MGQAARRTKQTQAAGPLIEQQIVERPVGRECGWCGIWVPYSGRGRPAAYCSKAHRNRASELRTTAARLQRDIAAGRIPDGPRREVIERTVVEVRVPAAPSRAREWEQLLDELAAQLADTAGLGRRHYDHPRIYAALMRVLGALDAAGPGGIQRLSQGR